jgi:CheY-like chemotaxis protein
MLIDKSIQILLVDDDDVDAMGFKRSLRKNKIDNPILRAHDGVEALEILRAQNTEKQPKLPVLIFLDLNMPRMNGIEFLDMLRGDATLKSHIVFVLTTSDDAKDRNAAYDKYISGYIVKSKAGENFIHLTSLIDDYAICVQFP